MLSVLVIAAVLVAGTVGIHAMGMALAVARLMSSREQPPMRLWPVTFLLVKVAWLLTLVHGAEISMWALFYWWEGCLPDAESAFYFSGVTYTTIGYGDLVLSKPWRMLGPIEGAIGILMCSLSAGLFFAVFTRIFLPSQARKGIC
jgi:hypothetical protein